MLNPTSLNLKSHHSLKSSSFHEGPPNQYLNPVSSRHKLAKKLSLNSKNQSFCAQLISQNRSHLSNNQFLQQSNYQPRTPRPIGSSPPKHDMVIALGNKVKEMTNQNPFQNIKGEISSKIDYILIQIEKQNKRLSAVQLRMASSTLHKQQISLQCNTQFKSANPFDATALNRDISQIKKQLSKMMNRDQINRQIQIHSSCLKQSFLEVKNTFQQHAKGLQTTILKIVNKETQILKQEILQTMENFEKFVTQQLKSKPISQYSQYFYETGSYVQKMTPLLKNPNLRLKFCGKVSLIDLGNKNPESEHLEWQVQNFNGFYMIDEEGCLLDDKQRYIVDSLGKCVRLNCDQVQLLLRMNILE